MAGDKGCEGLHGEIHAAFLSSGKKRPRRLHCTAFSKVLPYDFMSLYGRAYVASKRLKQLALILPFCQCYDTG